MVTAPFMAPYGTFVDLNDDERYIQRLTGHGVASAIYCFGDIAYHQEAARNFVLDGSQLPMCTRCCEIFTGLPVGFAVCWLIDRGLENRMASAWAYKGLVLEDMPALKFASGFLAGVREALFLDDSCTGASNI